MIEWNIHLETEAFFELYKKKMVTISSSNKYSTENGRRVP